MTKKKISKILIITMLVTMLGGCSLFGEPATPVVPDARTTGVTVTPEITPTPTSTPTPTPTKAVWVPKVTPTSVPDVPKVTPTNPPEPTAEPTAEPTVEPTQEVQPTVEPVVTEEPTYTPVPTDTPVPTATDTPVPTATLTPTNTPKPTATNTPKPTATNTPKPTATPKAYKLTVVDEYYRDGSTFLKSVTRTTADVRQGAAISTYYALATSSRAYKSGESGVSGVAFMGVSVSSSGFSVSNHGGTSQKVTGTMPGNDVVITYSYRVTFKASVTQPPKATSTPVPTELPPLPTSPYNEPVTTQTPGTTQNPKTTQEPVTTQTPGTTTTPEPEQRHIVYTSSWVEHNSKGEAIDCTETDWSDGSWEIVEVNRVTGYTSTRGIDENGKSYSYAVDGSYSQEEEDYTIHTTVEDGYTITIKTYKDGTWEVVSVIDPDGNDVTYLFVDP